MARSSSGASCSLWVGCKLPPGGGDVQGNGRQLGRHGHGDHGRDADVVQHPQQPAAQKPEHAEGALEHAVARGPAGLGHHGADRRLQDGLLGAHAHAPQGDAHQQGVHRVPGEHEDGEGRRQHRAPHQGPDPLLVIQQPEEQGRHRVHQHGPGIQQGQRSAGDQTSRFPQARRHTGEGPGDMHDDGIVDEAEGKQADAGDIQDELLLHVEGDVLLGLRLKVLRVGELPPGNQQQDQRDGPGDGQHRKACGIHLEGGAAGFQQHHHIQQHRPQERADLVQHLLDAEALAHPLLGGGKGHDGVLGGLFDGLAHALDHQQGTGPDPAVFSHQGQGRNRQNVQHIPGDGHGPVVLALIRQLAEHIPHGVAHQLPQARNEPDGPGGGPQQGQIRAPDAGRALVGHVRKQADDAEQHDEGHGLGHFLTAHNGFLPAGCFSHSP